MSAREREDARASEDPTPAEDAVSPPDVTASDDLTAAEAAPPDDAAPDGAPPEDARPEDRPRRSKAREAPEMPAGYRSTRRGSRAAKQAKRAARQHKLVTSIDTAGRKARNVGVLAAMGIGALVLAALVLFAGVSTVNWVARWSAERSASRSASTTQQDQKARENLLVIGERDGKAMGFLAMRIDEKGNQVFGVAVPDGAFIEVPGQGFERVGDSYLSGPDVSLAAISNFFTVPFTRYVVVPEKTYQEALRGQSVTGIMPAVSKSNLTDKEKASLTRAMGKMDSKNVALVPLQVKPISLGTQTYYEPQREELADLVESWWGVKLSDAESATRVIVYNGSGVPGIAGEAAQQLIRGGMRVVDTKNADRFDYAQTQIVVQNKNVTAGEAIRKVLGVGKVSNVPAEQDVADVIVIIGKDYKPPAPGG